MADKEQKKVIALMGPTASGKTAVAATLVHKWPLEIISVDSALVYRGMDIGTAKPDAELLARAPHRLINLRDPWETYSAARFAEDAAAAVTEIHAAGKIPLFVGGTMLYFQALERGLSPLPPADDEVRADLAAWAQKEGWGALHAYLQTIDPSAAARVHANDSQRIQRAIEVFRISGRSLTELQGEAKPALGPVQWLKLVISPADRNVLHQRIEQRFAQMIADGLLTEVEGLRQNPRLNADLPSMRSVGYRQAWQYLDGELDQEQFQAQGVYASRQLAKRQLTWLRKEAEARWIDPTEAGFEGRVEAAIEHFIAEML